MSVFDCRHIQSYPTTLPLMRGFVDKIKALEGKDGILSISIGHCFPYADVPELSARVLVIADGAKTKADALARELGEELVAMRGKTLPEYLDIDAAITAGLACKDGPVVLAEPADNAGGGAPSDNTSILRALVARDVPDAGIGPVWDPVAVRLAFDAGVGASLALRLGGKTGPASGQPFDAEVTVLGLAREAWQSFGPTKVPIEPTRKRLLVVKSTNHFMAAFGPIATKVLYVDSDAPLARDYRRVPYRRIQRPIWPLDEVTHPGLIY
jgi:microcystin degradation protein MlrC